jgi:hypothetical protein
VNCCPPRSRSYGSGAIGAWGFSFQDGFQLSFGSKIDSFLARVVHDGDISAVPVPAAAFGLPFLV